MFHSVIPRIWTTRYDMQSIFAFNHRARSKCTKSTVQKMKDFVKDFFRKCKQIHSFLWIWSHLQMKSLAENSFFGMKQVFPRICALNTCKNTSLKQKIKTI